METKDLFITQSYFEIILTHTNSVIIETKFDDNNDEDSIQFSIFTIKIILSPLEWFVDHLHNTFHYQLIVLFV